MSNVTPFPVSTSHPWASSPRSQHHTAHHTTLPAGHPIYDPLGEHRLAMMERKEPTRRLVRDVIAIRRMRKLSQAALADELGVSKRTWQEWEQGRRLPSGVGYALLKQWACKQPEWTEEMNS